MSAVLSTVRTPAEALTALRESTPLTQCLTNTVVTNFTANILLALGASPAMCDNVVEAGIFASFADGTLINLGTPHAEQIEAMREAAAATERWVLDPVAIGALPVRTALAKELLAERPAIIRGNASEIIALAGGEGGRGTDATEGPEAALPSARQLATATGAVVAISGEVDIITDGTREVRIPGGSELLTKVTGGGCSLGATMAAFLGVTEPFSAAVTASLVHARASERAAARADGPGSFAVGFIDEVASLAPADLHTGVLEGTESEVAA